MDDSTVTVITGPVHRPCQQTFHGYAKRSTYRETALPPRPALQPPTCSSLLSLSRLWIFSHLTHSCRTNLRYDAVDKSCEAQLVSIENSFAAARSSEQLSSLRHPTKPCLRAVSTYEVLPDADVWANAYDLFRFSERPGERGPELTWGEEMRRRVMHANRPSTRCSKFCSRFWPSFGMTTMPSVPCLLWGCCSRLAVHQYTVFYLLLCDKPANVCSAGTRQTSKSRDFPYSSGVKSDKVNLKLCSRHLKA